MEVTGQIHAPVRVHQEKGALSTHRKPYLVGPQGGCVHCEKDNNLRPRRESNSFHVA
jgi:hypothetical protein